MPERPATAPRISRLRALLRRSGLEAFLILDLKNIRYLTGFTGSDGALVVGAGKPALLVDGRYTTQARKQAPGARVVLYRDKVSGIADALSAGGVEQVGFEPAVATVELLSSLRRKSKKVRWKPLQRELGAIRAVKDAGEITQIRRAIRHCCRCPEVNAGAHPARSVRARHCHRARIYHAQHGRRSPLL